MVPAMDRLSIINDAPAVIVYAATNVRNGGVYVGVTARGLHRRRYEHEWNAANHKGGCRRFYTAIRKYGPDAFTWTVLASRETLAEALLTEMQFISESRPRYNLTAGGEGTVGVIRTSEYIERQRVAQTGRKQSAETIAKRVAALRGQKRTPEQRERIRVSMLGRVVSEDHRAKLSASHVGNGHSDETRRKMSATRIAISAVKKGGKE